MKSSGNSLCRPYYVRGKGIIVNGESEEKRHIQNQALPLILSVFFQNLSDKADNKKRPDSITNTES